LGVAAHGVAHASGKIFPVEGNFLRVQEIVKLKLVRNFFFLYKLTADQTRTLFQKILATV